MPGAVQGAGEKIVPVLEALRPVSSIYLIHVLRTSPSATGGQESNLYYNLILDRALESYRPGFEQ